MNWDSPIRIGLSPSLALLFLYRANEGDSPIPIALSPSLTLHVVSETEAKPDLFSYIFVNSVCLVSVFGAICIQWAPSMVI